MEEPLLQPYMRLKFNFILSICITAISAKAQNAHPLLVNIGDPVPQIQVKWLKGIPIEKFEKGTVYVLEFWATWCKPCITAMPHLSELAQIYNDKVTIIGIDIYEKNTTTIEKVKGFVDSMSFRMNYLVAADSNNFMVDNWILQMEQKEKGIPRTFVINAEGKLAWIGHPSKLDIVLSKLINNKWDLSAELAKQNEIKRLAKLDDSLRWKLINYSGDHYKQDYIGKPDSALLMISEIIKAEPKLKYAHFIAHNTFAALLKTEPNKAYEYGMDALKAKSEEDDPDNYFIIDNVKYFSDKLNIPEKIYELGAIAFQFTIDQITYPENVSLYKYYYNMAEWYWQAKNKSKAIEGMEKAIDNLKAKKNLEKSLLKEYEMLLQQFKSK